MKNEIWWPLLQLKSGPTNTLYGLMSCASTSTTLTDSEFLYNWLNQNLNQINSEKVEFNFQSILKLHWFVSFFFINNRIQLISFLSNVALKVLDYNNNKMMPIQIELKLRLGVLLGFFSGYELSQLEKKLYL